MPKVNELPRSRAVEVSKKNIFLSLQAAEY